MAKRIHRLSRKAPEKLLAGIHADGGGLYIRVKPTGGRSWLFIYQWHGRRREMGLGSALTVSLGDARAKAEEARKQVAQGIDPADPIPSGAEPTTFGDATTALLSTLEGGWKNAKHRAQWRNTLETYAASIWSMRVDEIQTTDVLKVLEPISSTKPETASRVRGRIERVLDAAKVRGQRGGENPARWRGHLEILLPKQRRKAGVKHHAAMPYDEVPSFVRSLKPRLSTAARALEFLILTAARTGEVLGATWKEIDLDGRVWTVHAERMKGGIEHRVPLSPAAVAVLNAVAYHGTDADDFVFPSQKPNSALSNMVFAMLLRRMKVEDVTAHGFRSSFRDWAAEAADCPREIAEAALAHQVGNAVERAYRRGDALEKRRALMLDWAAYVCGAATAKAERA